MNISKIVQRKGFSDYLVEADGLKKVVSVRGISGSSAIEHLKARFESEPPLSNGKLGDTGYWGWTKTVKEWFPDTDIIAKNQGAY